MLQKFWTLFPKTSPPPSHTEYVVAKEHSDYSPLSGSKWVLPNLNSLQMSSEFILRGWVLIHRSCRELSACTVIVCCSRPSPLSDMFCIPPHSGEAVGWIHFWGIHRENTSRSAHSSLWPEGSPMQQLQHVSLLPSMHASPHAQSVGRTLAQVSKEYLILFQCLSSLFLLTGTSAYVRF